MQNWGRDDHFIKCVYSYCYKVIHLKKMTFKTPCPVGGFTMSVQVCCRGLDCLVSPTAFTRIHQLLHRHPLHRESHLAHLMSTAPCPIQDNSYQSQCFRVMYSEPLMVEACTLEVVQMWSQGDLVGHTGLFSCRHKP